VPRGEPRTVYEGTTSGWRERGLTEPHDVAFKHAVLDAYEAARENGETSSEFRVVAIIIKGDNPPSDYKVQIVAHP
jgi:hypothetical protein